MKLNIFQVLVTFFVGTFSAKSQTFQLVKDLYPSTEHLLYDYDAGMTYFNGKLYFTSYFGDIVVSDGSSSGTQIISNLGMQKMTALDFHKNRFVPMGDKLYYKNRRNELCVTDGTTNGTTMVADIHPTDTSEFYGVKTIVGATNDKFFFVGNDGVHGFELWVSDGTESGTQLISDFAPGVIGFFHTTSKHHVGTVIDNKLYFFANDQTNGWEPWVSDGTPAGTFMLVNSNPTGHCSNVMAATIGGFAGSEMKFFPFNNAVYFTAYDGIYKTDGTVSGTTLEISGSSYGANLLTSMCVFDNHLYFDHFSTGKRMLGKSDGTLAGTVLVDTLPGALSRGFQVFDGTLYFRCKPTGYSSSDRDYIAKLTGSEVDSLSRATSGYFNQGVSIVQPIGADFLYLGDYNNHGIFRYNNGENVLVNQDFTSTFDNLLSTPIGTFAIGTNSAYGYELWKWVEGTSVDVEELDSLSFGSIYPNPVTNILTLQLDKSSTIRVVNALGIQVLPEQSVVKQLTLDVSTLSPGVYYIVYEAGETIAFVKR